jgi:2,3-dihydro-2,3-dihydroxybenzoate dehydrogenase
MRNRVAIVTGAAGGIGSAVATALGERGVSVAAVDRDADGLRTVVEKLTAEGVRVKAFVTDATDSAGIESTVDEVERHFGPVDYLVNAAGILRLGEARHISDDDLAATFAVNVGGVCYMSRAVVNRMVPRASGSIVTVASNAASTPRVQMAAYAASKAAATMFTKCLALEVAEHGIRCNVVAPGSTDTPMLRSMWHDETGPAGTIDGRPDAYRVGIPLRRIATASDIADAVVFLLSDDARHITMHSLTVDGGAGLGA